MKPILFNTKMVMAVKDDRKTATRRIVKPQPDAAFPYCHEEYTGWHWTTSDGDDDMMGWWPSFEKGVKPPYQPGDILYVRETWAKHPHIDGAYMYRAFIGTGLEPEKQDAAMLRMGLKWHPSIYMPKEAARLLRKRYRKFCRGMEQLLRKPAAR